MLRVPAEAVAGCIPAGKTSAALSDLVGTPTQDNLTAGGRDLVGHDLPCSPTPSTVPTGDRGTPEQPLRPAQQIPSVTTECGTGHR